MNAKPKVLDLDAQVGTKLRQRQETCRHQCRKNTTGLQWNEREGKERVAALLTDIWVCVSRKKEPAVSQNTFMRTKHTKMTLVLHLEV